MPERRRDDHDPHAQRARARAPEPPINARVARVLALQRSAGNHAVAAALGRRSLARLTDEEIAAFSSPQRAVYDEAEQLYDDTLGPDGEYAARAANPTWSSLVDKAGDARSLLNLVKREVGKAKEWFDTRPQTPAPAPQPQSPATPFPGASKRTKRPKQKQPKAAQPQTQAPAPQQPTAPASATAPAGPQGSWAGGVQGILDAVDLDEQKSPPIVDILSFTTSLTGWDGVSHAGRNGLALDATQVDAIIVWLATNYPNSSVFKGEGSGSWGKKKQLKVMGQGVVSGKTATFHISLSDKAYTAANVHERHYT